MKTFIYTLCLLFSGAMTINAQHRYLEEGFSSVKITNDIEYGINATILYLAEKGFTPETLTLDLYEPVGDDARNRGLVIYFHSGNFLPFPDNQNVNGTKRDSAVVEMCRRLARRGFVVASADYRLGWNPLIFDNELARTTGLINAAYRGVQDANTCIRFFKKSFVEDGNPFGIDTSRIVLWGDDSGGYIALHAGCLDDYDKIPTATGCKFCIPTGDPLLPFIPMIFEHINGDVEAKTYGINNPPIPGFPYPPGDTLCYPNHVNYSSDFMATVNLSGAVADTAWIDPGQPKIISVHTPHDQSTPYEHGWVYVEVPGMPLRVIYVHGSKPISELSNAFGNNDCMRPWNVTPFQWEVTDVANARNEGNEGLFPIYGDTISDATPWVFWDPATNVNSPYGFYKNPHMTRAKAEIYMDSILAYVIPRLYECLILATDALPENEAIQVSTYPNPASEGIQISAPSEMPIHEVHLFDMRGALIAHRNQIDDAEYYLKLNNITPGTYVLVMGFEKGLVVRQVLVH